MLNNIQWKDALFKMTELIVFDFDGVFTDNKVYVNESGIEMVRCDRADSLGIGFLRDRLVPMLVLSTEANRVVKARCSKLKLECIQGVEDKETVLGNLLEERGLSWSQVAYMGNDVNDLACMFRCGLAIAPCDAHPKILNIAHLVTTRKGGDGAVREMIETALGL